MASPFVYEEPVEPAALIDRVAELGVLTDRALDARNSRLEGARRVWQDLAAARDAGRGGV